MATSSPKRRARPSHPPLWLVEGLDIVQRKRWVLAAVVIVVVALGGLASIVFPATIPTTAGVGAAVGVAALLLGVAAAVASDATELIVRGPRHVAAAGGELVAVLPRAPSVASAGPLAGAIDEVREPGAPLLLAFATAGRDARRTVAWTDAIARSLVGRDLGVLRVDLASGRSEDPGLFEVVREGARLADVVEFEPGVKLARLRAGRDHGEALDALAELPGRLPRDLDILLVSLPTAVSRPVVAAAAALDHVLVVVERDRTSRVDLIASLDALEAAGTNAQVVLLDTTTAMRLAPPVEVDPDGEPIKRGIASTVGTSPTVEPGSDGQPVEVDDVVPPVGDDAEHVEDGQPVPMTGTEEPLEELEEEAPLVGEVEEPVDEELPADQADQVEEPADEVETPVAEVEEPVEDPADPDERVVEGAPRRDVDVLEAAAAATAMSITDAEQEPLDERFGDLHGRDDPDDVDGDDTVALGQLAQPHELPQPQEQPLVEPPVELAAEPQAAADDLAYDDTDRIPRVGGAHEPRPDPADADPHDMLRTTAQLAMLTQDINLRQGAAPDENLPVADAAPGDAGSSSPASRARDIVQEIAGEGVSGAGDERETGAGVEEATDVDDDEAR